MKEEKNKNTSRKNCIHGFKVFNHDWTCSANGNIKQYACPGKFEEEGELDICGHGMHFCQTITDCFKYYNFNSNNKVAEVIAYGEVQTEGSKSCTDKLEIVREIPWYEVLQIVNIGKDCTGRSNTGDRNTGNFNTGNFNTGDRNTGNFNTGNFNTGDRNIGNCNTGDRNTEDRNTGHRNTGHCNTGNFNAGNFNAGHRNTGHCNTGNFNAGNCNAGDFNTGDFNKSSFNTGCFNTVDQKISLFNKPSDITYREWINSDARCLLIQIPKNVVTWIGSGDMTDKEKEQHPEYKITNGYLKVLDESECSQSWWDNLSDADKDIILNIPNFDKKIFEECTGIKVE